MTLSPDEYWNQGTKRLEQYHGAVTKIVESFPEPRRAAVTRMLGGPLGEQFMTAPASTRRAYHNAYPCGLVAHSLTVATNAAKIANTLAPGRWDLSQLMFCGLFHDFGKAGSPGKPYYLVTGEDWKRRKEEYYDVSHEEWMPNSEKSVWLLQSHGVPLTHEEYVAIRLNDGMGPAENKPWSFREPDLALVVHWADHWAMRSEQASAGVIR